MNPFYSLWADSEFLFTSIYYINSIIFISVSLFFIRRGDLFTETGRHTSKLQHRNGKRCIHWLDLLYWQTGSFECSFFWMAEWFSPSIIFFHHCCSLHCRRMSTSVATQANERSVSVASQDTVCTTGLLMGMSSLSWFWLVRAPFHCSDWLSKSRSCFIASFDGESFWFNFKGYLTQRWEF